MRATLRTFISASFASAAALTLAAGLLPATAGAVPATADTDHVTADALNPGVLSTPASDATLDAAPGATRAVTGPAAVTSTPPTVRTEKPRAVPWNSTAEWVEAYFRTPDGTILHADILRPKNLPKGARIPVIMTVSPYTNHLTDQGYLGALNGTTPEFGRPTEPSTRFQDLIDGTHLMERGYAFVQVDTRGTGGSTGCLDYGGPGEQQDVSAAVRWAAAQPWSTGKVGLYGKSYDGGTGLAGVANAPQGLAAVVSQEPIFDPYTYIFHNRVPYYNALFMGTWYGQIAVTPGRPFNDTPYYLRNSLYEFAHPHCVIDNSRNQYSPDPNGPYWSQRTIVAKANKSPVPLFITQGFIEDNTRPDGLQTLLQNRKAPTRGWLGMWNHIRGNDTDENGTPKIGRRGFFTEVMDFYDHYVKGTPSKGHPNFIIHTNTGWRSQAAWPQQVRQLQLDGPRGLITDDGLAVGAATTTGGGALPANVAARANMKNGIWSVYPAQRQDLRIEGRMDLRIMLSTLDKGLNVIADLYDIAPNGKAMLITRGATPVTAGRKQTTFRTFPTDWTLRKGHRLALRLVNTNVEVYAHVPTGGKVQIMRTWLTVPVGGGQTAPTYGGTPAYWKTYVEKAGYYPGIVPTMTVRQH